MTDFYAILKNAIAESKADNASRRAALYARARASLNKQLESLKPPLSAAARQEQRETLERAVRRIEAEAGARPAAAPSPSPATPQPKQPERPAEKPADVPPAAKEAETTPAAVKAAAPSAAAPEAAAPKAAVTKPPRPRSRAVTLVPLLVLLVVVVGGALAYWQWDAIGPRLTGMTEQTTTRLGTDVSEPTPAMAPEPPAMAEPAPAMPPAPEPMETMEQQPQTPMPAASGQEPEMAATEAPPAETPAETPPETPAVAPPAEAPAVPQADAAAEPDKDQSRVPAATLPTERAYLLLEQQPAGTPDKRYAGTALWSLGGSGADTSVAVAVNYPDLSADISMVFRLNTDSSLPASHTIDVVYHGPAKPDGTIAAIAGLMIRSDASDNSVPLQGAGAEVVPGQFLFGLSNEADAMKHNISLLKDGNWLLMPVQFDSKRRSVIVIEKGATGKEAMDKAFTAWEKAQPPAKSQ